LQKQPVLLYLGLSVVVLVVVVIAVVVVVIVVVRVCAVGSKSIYFRWPVLYFCCAVSANVVVQQVCIASRVLTCLFSHFCSVEFPTHESKYKTQFLVHFYLKNEDGVCGP